MSKVMYKAQRYRDFGYARGFKERFGTGGGPWFRDQRFHRSRWAAFCRDDMDRLASRRFTWPVTPMVPVLPRWSS